MSHPDLSARWPDTEPTTQLADVDLTGLDALPVAEHAGVYDGLHVRLQEALTSLDEL